MATETRALAAIMFTDMVGYSAISQKNEALALELLENHRNILRDIFPTFNGDEIKTIGDAFLVKFHSALDAVLCGIEIQKTLKDYNSSAEKERKIMLRIGIHMGDVVQRDNDIYGDGVNISSRIEPLAEPGGICISEDVARQVENKISEPLEKMGSRELKNIKLPMKVYQIVLYATPVENVFEESNNKLAVLPFQNISPEKETDYFSDGLTEEIIMHLSGIKELRVISRTTSMQYKNVNKDINTIGRELDARYILEGSVRKFKDDLRITAQLIDVKTDSHLWAETYRGNLEDIFDIQENVSKQIVQALRLTLSPAEEVALSKRATLDSKAYDINLRAREFLFRLTKGYLLSAIDLFNSATELDSRYAAAYAGAGEAYAQLFQFFDKDSKWLDKAMEASLKALMYDSSSSEAYTALALVYYNKEQYNEAMSSVQKAIELDKHNFFAYWVLGRILFASDQFAEAEKSLKTVLELNPDFHSAYMDLQMVYGKLNDVEKHTNMVKTAANFYPNYLLRFPDDARAHLFYASTLVHQGNIESAKQHMARAVALSPNEPIIMYNVACFYSQIKEKELAVEHLIKAVNSGYRSYDYIKHDPDFDFIRNEPGYIELMKDK